MKLNVDFSELEAAMQAMGIDPTEPLKDPFILERVKRPEVYFDIKIGSVPGPSSVSTIETYELDMPTGKHYLKISINKYN